ncbi:MAG: type II toxin-antitoxin system prevent-host-death family antitoxin [Campylobacterota bacterium]|nr:type II toxin-antitoxin system prevent-host-death family antitoxin [Campylobacterota bacterium]
MTVTAKDLRFNSSMLFDMLSRGEEIIITYRGKAKAKLTSFEQKSDEPKSDKLFGMWSDKEMDVDKSVRSMRQGRSFDIR